MKRSSFSTNSYLGVVEMSLFSKSLIIWSNIFSTISTLQTRKSYFEYTMNIRKLQQQKYDCSFCLYAVTWNRVVMTFEYKLVFLIYLPIVHLTHEFTTISNTGMYHFEVFNLFIRTPYLGSLNLWRPILHTWL